MLDYQLGEPTVRSARAPRTVSAWSAFLMPFLPFVYGYPSSSPRAHCTPNTSVPTLRYTRRHGPIYACWHLPSAVPWISEDHLLHASTAVHSLKKAKEYKKYKQREILQVTILLTVSVILLTSLASPRWSWAVSKFVSITQQLQTARSTDKQNL